MRKNCIWKIYLVVVLVRSVVLQLCRLQAINIVKISDLRFVKIRLTRILSCSLSNLMVYQGIVIVKFKF